MLKLSVLDQSTVVTGRGPDEAIRESLELARHIETLGYARYWVAEHHASDSQAGTAPEILIAAIAATTRRIRVGSAGVMLPHYSSLKVAEQFRVLEAIAPGRIDLGLGRAPGSDQRTALALNPNAATAADLFPAQVRDVIAWSSGAPLVDGHPFAGVRAQPGGPTAPEIWVLGSSGYGAQVAAHFGLPYCFAHFITDGAGADEALALYRDLYRPSARHPEPHAALTVWALAGETEAAAEYHFASRAAWRLGRDRGVYTALPSPDEALARAYTDAEHARMEALRRRSLHGTGEQVARHLIELADEHDVDEFAILTTMHDAAARRRSYALIAAAVSAAAGQTIVAAET